MPNLRLNGRTAIIAGGSAGIGRAVLDAFHAEGMRVGVIARDETRLAEIEREFGTSTDDGRPRVATASADVSDAAALEAAAERIIQSLGAPDVWVNCAMQTAFSPFEEMPPEEFKRIVDVTLLGQVNGCRIALKHMTKGRIVNVGSGLSYRAVPMQSAYCSAKHGINGFTGSLRSELLRAKRPISLSLVQLPAVNTPQFDWAQNRLAEMPQPAPPIYAPQAAAAAIVKAAKEGTRELLVGKSVLQLVFGQMVLPDWLDKKMAGSGADMQKSGTPDPGDRPDNLHTPVAYPSRPEGSYTDRQNEKAITLDADKARMGVFFGVPALVFLLGLALG